MTANQVLFIVGGARSGKSRLAQNLASAAEARAWGPVVFVATATAGDDDMAARIARHRADRPPHWHLVEAPTGLVAAIEAVSGEAIVVIDCLTMWTANLLLGQSLPADDSSADRVIEAEAERLALRLVGRSGPSIVVSNEVGLSVHPETVLGRRYQDLLGRVNQTVAHHAGRSVLMVAGRALELSEPARLLADWPPQRSTSA